MNIERTYNLASSPKCGRDIQRPAQLLILVIMSLMFFSYSAYADSTATARQDAMYNRPFIDLVEGRTAVGGYLEANTNFFSEDGIDEGFSFEMRRFNIFLYARISERIKFLSELEFEHGTEEIAVETAQLDFEFDPAFNVRGGIILPALGLVNTNHDSPNWEFVERPISSTDIIPTTLSEPGFGIFGLFHPDESSAISYDLYLVNGLGDGVILNDRGRTDLSSGKSEEVFAEDNNGEPMFNSRVAYIHNDLGEFGISFLAGAYNTFEADGEEIDEKRMLKVTALDFSLEIEDLTIQGEAVIANVEVPDDIDEIYGETQFGGFVDLIHPILQRPIFNFPDAELLFAVRFEYADFNLDEFTTNISGDIGDETVGFALGLSLRPTSGTVIRANYRQHWITDMLNNPSVKRAGIQLGIASYF